MPDTTSNRRRLGRWRPQARRSPRNRRRASPVRLALQGVLITLAGPALWSIFHSPRLSVRRVEVIGADRLGEARVRRLAGIPVGRNIFCVNLYRARISVESDPLVASAEVSRALPDAIRILVDERRAAFVVWDAGQFYEMDEAGVLFRRVAKPTPRVPLLSLKNVGPVAVGQRLRADVIRPALACLQQSTDNHLLLWKINIDGPHELCLNIKVSSRAHPQGRSLRIRVGRSEDLALKLTDARKVLAGRPQIVDEAQTLDVSCAGRPVYVALASAGAPPDSTRAGLPSSVRPEGHPPRP